MTVRHEKQNETVEGRLWPATEALPAGSSDRNLPHCRR